MADYQVLVANIRGFVASSYQMKTDEVVAWAEQYARLCREANERLQQCSDYLKQSLRVEAIHCAETAPNLLDLVATLDMPELAEWKQVCFRLELPDAPPLMLDAAATLNEAYAHEQPLEALMAYHRMMALAGAPLKQRLAVMRRIDEQDTTSTVLAEDIRTFESLRLEEIRSGLGAMARRGNLGEAFVLQDELKQPWRTTVPPDLRRMVDDLSLKFQQTAAEAELRALMPKLNDAYGAMSLEESRTLLGQFLSIAAQARLRVPPDLQEQIDPIQGWLTERNAQQEQQAAFQQACNALQQAIDTEAPLPQMEQRYREAVHSHQDLPVQLETRYQDTLVRRAAAIRHKRVLVISAVIGAFLLVSGIAVAITRQVLRSNEIAASVALIQQAAGEIDIGNVDRPRQVVKQLRDQHPGIVNDPLVIKAMSDFTAAATAEDQRHELVSTNLATALTNGVDKPDMKALQAATSGAKTPAEQQAAAEVKARIDDYAREAQSKVDEKFTEEAKALSHDLDEQLTSAAMTSSPAECAKKIENFTLLAKELSRRTGVSAGLRQAQSQSILAILRQRQATLEETATLAALLTRIEQAKSVQEQSSALKAVLATTVDAKYTIEFKRTLELAPLEQAVEAWGQLTGGWNGQALPATFAAASARAGDLEKYLQANPDGPLSKDIEEYRSYLKLGLEVAAPTGPWRKSYHDLMLNPLVHDLGILTNPDGKRWFTLGDPKFKPIMLNDQVVSQKFEAITSSDISHKEPIELRAPAVVKSSVPTVSPQALYAKAILPKLELLEYTGWESIGGRCLRDLMVVRDMDPILKAILVNNILRLNQSVCDWAGDTDFKKTTDALASQNVDDIEWLNPDNPPRAAVLTSINNLIAHLPTSEQMEKSFLARRDKALAGLPVGLTIGGVLLKEEGKARLVIHNAATTAQVAYGIGASKHLIIVARRDAKGWTIDPVAATDVPAGSLLFIAGPVKPLDATHAKTDAGDDPVFQKGLKDGSIPTTLVFVASAGGSMVNDMASAKDVINKRIGMLRQEQSFNVIFTMQDGIEELAKSPSLLTANNENKHRASVYVEGIFARGVSDLHPGMAAAFADSPQAIFLFTRGYGLEQSLEADIAKLNPGKKVRIHVIQFVGTKDQPEETMILQRIAAQNRGSYTVASDAD